MNIKAKIHPMFPIDKEANMAGVGANAIWNGPFDSTGYPKGKGNSAGKDGIKLRFDETKEPTGLPITQRVKGR